jgi:hypothetical protein
MIYVLCGSSIYRENGQIIRIVNMNRLPIVTWCFMAIQQPNRKIRARNNIPTYEECLKLKLKLKLIYDRQSVGQSVLVSGIHLGP